MSEIAVVTDRREFRAAAARVGTDGARVPVEVRVTVADPYDAYRRAREGPGGVFLETTGGQAGWGYFATDPVDRLTVSDEAVRWRGDRGGPEGGQTGRGDSTEATDPTRRFAGQAASPSLAALAGLLDGEALVRGDCDVPYPCGAFGWLSYDLTRELEAVPDDTPDDRGLPRLEVGVYDLVAAWKEPRLEGDSTTLRITACPRVEAGGDDDLDAVYEKALGRARGLADRAVSGHLADPETGVSADAVTFESTCGRAAFGERVRTIKDAIRAGDTFQANVSQRLVAPAAVHPLAAYAALREVNPAPYSGLLEFPSVDLVSASPELLLDHDGDGGLLTEPIAGTRPRGDDEAEDEALAADLTGDEKERAEHAMLVDLERNDLGKVSEYGTVAVPEYRRVDRYSEVMHLVSLVEGDLAADATVSDAVAAMFPGGTITGAPKPKTMELIESVEDRKRGPYTGSIGVFGFDGRATLNITIRTLVRQADEYHLSVGAGIVHDSEPDAEYDETLDKARALVRAVDEALDRGDLSVAGDRQAGDPGGEQA